jgi:hypothetical protein
VLPKTIEISEQVSGVRVALRVELLSSDFPPELKALALEHEVLGNAPEAFDRMWERLRGELLKSLNSVHRSVAANLLETASEILQQKLADRRGMETPPRAARPIIPQPSPGVRV